MKQPLKRLGRPRIPLATQLRNQVRAHLTDDEYRELLGLAGHDGVKLAAVIRKALREYIEQRRDGV